MTGIVPLSCPAPELSKYIRLVDLYSRHCMDLVPVMGSWSPDKEHEFPVLRLPLIIVYSSARKIALVGSW